MSSSEFIEKFVKTFWLLVKKQNSVPKRCFEISIKLKWERNWAKKILLWRTSKSESPYVCNCKSGFNGHRCERISSSNYYSNDISAQPISAFVPAFSNGLQRPNSLSASQVKVTKNYKVNIFIFAIFSKKNEYKNYSSNSSTGLQTVSIGGKQRQQLV